jgi:hypothetical protein
MPPSDDLPPDWDARDAVASFYEYVALCRQAWLRGEPPPPFFQAPRRPPIPKETRQ